MKKMDKITVIIPVHELNDTTQELFEKSLISVKNQIKKADNVMVVIPDNDVLAKYLDEVSDKLKIKLNVAINKGESDFSTQLNYGVSKTETKYFTFLEYDDELMPMHISNAKKYINNYEDVSLFLPLIVNRTPEGKSYGLSNEPVWANEFSDKLGELDTECLLRYSDFNMDGMVMSKEKYIALGGLKPSIELTFPYEFLLRVTHNEDRVMVIPKFGYIHTILREGSIFSEYKKTLSTDEQRWWLALAKKEYLHKEDREIRYEK